MSISTNSKETGTEILVVDDDQGTLNLFERVLLKAHHKTTLCQNSQEAVKVLENKSFPLVFLDIHMPVINGIQLLEEIKVKYPDTLVIMITAFATVASAVETMKKGAYDYITKPLRIEEIKGLATRALERQKREVAAYHEENQKQQAFPGFANIVGQSKKMRELYSLIRVIAPSDSTILITGESGTGKELVARAIHASSQRHHKQMITVNCADIPDSVMENELFGHTKGSYTGAYRDQKGLLELADGGTVFLDEIGDLPEITQVKLLRFLQEHEVKRLGGLQYKKVNVRVIAATNSDLVKKIERGTFRQDLYFRLRVIPIHLPPLRERQDDLPLLARHFMNIYARKYNKRAKELSSQALSILLEYPWPGNVRELENLVEYLTVISNNQIITQNDLPAEFSTQGVTEEKSLCSFAGMNYREAKEKVISEFTQEFIRENLIIAGGNVTRAAEIIGIERANLHRLIRKYGIDLISLT